MALDLYKHCMIQQAKGPGQASKDVFEQLRYDIEGRVYTFPVIPYLDSFPVVGEGRCLDCGCAYGTMTVYLATLGWKVHALDINLALMGTVSQKFASQMTQIDLERDALGPERFELIVFTEMLEHMTGNPLPVLGKLHEALAPGGQLLLSTPNRDAKKWTWGRGEYQKNARKVSWRDLKDPVGKGDIETHYYVYNAEDLAGLLQESPFEIMKFEATDMTLFAVLRREQ